MNLRNIKLDTKPKYIHDCDDCEYITTHNKLDLYFCKKTIVFRSSNEPSDNQTYQLSTIKHLASQNYIQFKNILKILEQHNIIIE
jgi:hypothetical protein